MPTYAITGSSGYIGSRMVEALLARPESRVIGIDVRPPRVAPPGLEFHQVDVRDAAVADVLAGRDVSALLHFAFIVDPLYDAAEMRDIDLGGTAKVPHIVATSSTSAYGALADNPVPLREDDPCRAAAPFNYAYDKRLMDDM